MKAAFLLLCNHIHYNISQKIIMNNYEITSNPQKIIMNIPTIKKKKTCNPHQTTIKLPFKITICTKSPSNPHQNPAGLPVKKIDPHLLCQLSHGLRLQQQVITITGEAVQAPQATIQGLARSAADHGVAWLKTGFTGGFMDHLWGFIVNLWDFHGIYGQVMIS